MSSLAGMSLVSWREESELGAWTQLTWRPRAHSFSQLALAHGYYDQSHMNADFREFAGIPPGQFLAATTYPESLSVAD
ncbi:helix-turn-helix domain-containing protein [Promicromonospora soli]